MVLETKHVCPTCTTGYCEPHLQFKVKVMSSGLGLFNMKIPVAKEQILTILRDLYTTEELSLR